MNLVRRKDYLIERAFPELSDVCIEMLYRKMRDAYFECVKLDKNRYRIAVDRGLMNAPRDVVLGGLSHEMVHISKMYSRNWLINGIDALLCAWSIRYQTCDERRTDLEVIKRGLGKELLAFVEYADRRREDYDQTDGLTAAEINTLLKDKK